MRWIEVDRMKDDKDQLHVLEKLPKKKFWKEDVFRIVRTTKYNRTSLWNKGSEDQMKKDWEKMKKKFSEKSL